MNKRLIAFSLAAAFAAMAAASGEHKPTKGGVFAPGKEADYELVAKPTVLQLYVFDHGKQRDVSKAAAKVTLLTAGQKQEVELKPVGDKLEASGTFQIAPGTKAVAVVSDGGKALGTARFTLK